MNKKIDWKKLGKDLFKEYGGIPFFIVVYGGSVLFSGLVLYYVVESTIGTRLLVSFLNSFGIFWMYVTISIFAGVVYLYSSIVVLITIKWCEVNYKEKQKKKKNKWELIDITPIATENSAEITILKQRIRNHYWFSTGLLIAVILLIMLLFLK